MRVARVMPDVAVDKEFDYLVPESLAETATVGSIVRVDLHGRRVRAWITGLSSETPPGVVLKPIAKVSGHGPSSEVIALARWGAWRYAGRTQSMLGTASPETAVRFIGRRGDTAAAVHPVDPYAARVASAIADAPVLARVTPSDDPLGIVQSVSASGSTLVIVPSIDAARLLAARLARSGRSVAMWPHEWAHAAAGRHIVVGARSAVWATVPDLTAIVVIDEHDEGHQQEQAPSWHARDVALERARRLGIPCVMTSPVGSLEARTAARTVLEPSRSDDRAGWALFDILDRRHDDPTTGLYSPRIVTTLRTAPVVVCVLNRTGRARLVVCGSARCGEVARCTLCAGPLMLDDDGLVCQRCGERRPKVCAVCASTTLRALRAGVTRVREELAALSGRSVVEVTGAKMLAYSGQPDERALYIGTEAVLHQVPRADAVIFLDFDQELMAPRSRASEQSLGLLVRASRLVGPRAGGGRVLVQTRMPRHDVLVAALHADPDRWAAIEATRRQEMDHPPYSAVALVSGPAAGAYIDALGSPGGVAVAGPTENSYRLRADNHQTLCDALAKIVRPSGRVRVEVDPLRI